jgi:imidazolonepropionase-like amidohydrolase
MADLILTNLQLLDPSTGKLRSGVHVRVGGNAIQEVSEAPPPRGSFETFDLGGRVLMPGLIDCHVHVTGVFSATALQDNRHYPNSLVQAYAARSLRQMLMGGFTTVRDAGGADMGHKMAVERRLLSGPRLFISGRAISQTGGHGDFRERVDAPDANHFPPMFGGIGRIADGVAAVRQAARDEIRLGADHIKIMASGGVSSAADPIHFVQFSVEELEAFVEEAENADTYVMAHAYTAKAIKRAVLAGVRSIEHGNLIDEEAAALIAKRGAYLVPTLATYREPADPASYDPVKLVKLRQIIAAGTRSLEIARNAGVKMAYGTDLVAEGLHHQTSEFLIRSAVMTPLEQLRSATLTGAELLRQEGRLGVIAPGALADMIVVDGNPLDDIGVLARQGETLAMIVADGEIAKNRLN